MDWEPTIYSYPVQVTNGTNGTYIILVDNSTTLNISYVVTCYGPANQVLVGRTNFTWFVFKKKDGVLAGSDYVCSVQTVEVSMVNNSKKVVSRTSVDSQSVFQTTIEGKGMRQRVELKGRFRASCQIIISCSLSLEQRLYDKFARMTTMKQKSNPSLCKDYIP